jgi:hypothetical protein
MQTPFLFLRILIIRDWRFLAVTIVACGVAAVVASFQFAVFTSFLRAGAVIPRTVDADFWITAHSVECFDFPSPISEDYAATLSRYVPDARFRRVVFGFATWRSPTGRLGNVAIVGIDDAGLPETGFAADQSDLARLDISHKNIGIIEASIADTTLYHARTVDNLSTFLGAPYVIVPFDIGRRMLRMDPTSTSFLIGNFTGGPRPDFDTLAQQVSRKFPDVSLVSAEDFETSSSLYWQKKTGAGAAILLAAILAALLMIILLANGISRFIQRYQQDLLSLLGHGGSAREVAAIIFLTAVLVAIVSLAMALAVTPIAIWIAKPLLPWVSFRILDMWLPLLAIIAAAATAILSSRRALLAFGPEAVFRT